MLKSILLNTLLLFSANQLVAQSDTISLFIGTYTNSGKSKGIGIYHFDTKTGNTTLDTVLNSEDPSFLTLNKNKNLLLTVNEKGNNEGTVSAFVKDSTGWRLLNSQLTLGSHPCHILLDKSESRVFVSNYSSGSFSVYNVSEEKGLSSILHKYQYIGMGPDTIRQKSPHIHSAFMDEKEQNLYVQDLGTDKLYVYDFTAKEKIDFLEPAKKPFVQLPDGVGPRHIAIDKNHKFIYVVEEMTGNISVIQKNRSEYNLVQTLSINTADFSGNNGAADIKISPNGQYLYATNRGESNTIALFKINNDNGQLEKIENYSVMGNGPRNFNFSPDGKYLLVANQLSNEVVIFECHPENGRLTDTGKRIQVGAPVCIVF